MATSISQFNSEIRKEKNAAPETPQLIESLGKRGKRDDEREIEDLRERNAIRS